MLAWGGVPVRDEQFLTCTQCGAWYGGVVDDLDSGLCDECLSTIDEGDVIAMGLDA